MSADKDLISVQQARDLVEAAHRAQSEIVRFDQGKIDRICETMAWLRCANRRAWRRWLLKKPVTAFAADKQVKNRFAAEDRLELFQAPPHGRRSLRDAKTSLKSPARAASWPGSFLQLIPLQPLFSKF